MALSFQELETETKETASERWRQRLAYYCVNKQESSAWPLTGKEKEWIFLKLPKRTTPVILTDPRLYKCEELFEVTRNMITCYSKP